MKDTRDGEGTVEESPGRARAAVEDAADVEDALEPAATGEG
jgi:hypothetical protein